MGTDIHLWVETRKADGEPWEKVGAIFPYEYYKPDKESKIDDDGYEWNPQFVDEPLRTYRNYTAFAVLAGVRNGVGFAGNPRGSKVVPIAEPRDWPADVSPELRKIYDNELGHTPSWLMLHELLDYNWDQPYTQIGVLSADQYEQLKSGAEPEEWCGGISGPGIIVYDEHEYLMRKSTSTLPKQVPNEYQQGKLYDADIYVRAAWPQEGGLRAALGKYWISFLAGMADGYDPENTRLLFYFDS